MRQLFNRYRSRLYPFLAVTDQALQSLVNLLANMFLIRFASRVEYGVYGIGFTSIMLILGLSHALFGLQMTVLAPDKPEAERKPYFASMLVSMCVVLLLLVAMALLVAVVSEGWIADEYRTLIVVVAFALPGVVIMQFVRQVFYFFNQAHRVLAFDVVFFLVFLAILMLLVFLDVSDLHLWALLMNGVVMLLVGLMAIAIYLRFDFREASRQAKTSLVEAWHSGSWAVLGSILTVLQTQGYVYLLALFHGPAAVAGMNAARLFLSPLQLMVSGFSKVTIPKMALLKASGNVDRAVKVALVVMAVLILFLLLYLGVLALGWDWFQALMEERGYEDLWVLVALWGVYFLSNILATAPIDLLQIFREFRLLTLMGMLTSVLVLSASIPAIWYHGAVGALLALIVGEIGLSVLLWTRFQAIRKTTD